MGQQHGHPNSGHRSMTGDARIPADARERADTRYGRNVQQGATATRKPSAYDEKQEIGRGFRDAKPQGKDRHSTRVHVAGFDQLREHIKREPQPQPAPLVFKGETNRYYETKRNGQITKVFLISVDKDQVVYKDNENDKHTKSMSLARFMKFYS